MIYTKKQIHELDRIKRLKIINSVTGIKPANLIGTINSKGDTNLAIFSSVVHLGSNPPLLAFVSRPKRKGFGHTFRNIEENGQYTINHVHPEFIKNAHYTSAKFEAEVSEFERCNFSEEYHEDFKAPFIKESTFKMGMSFKEVIEIKSNGTFLIVGEIEYLLFPDTAMITEEIDLELSKSVGISGLNSYYTLKKLDNFPFARVHEVPEF